MIRNIQLLTFVVKEYDEAIDFFVHKIGFYLIQDEKLQEGKRWVVVGPKHSHGTNLLLAKAVTSAQQSRIGDQTGGRVAFFLNSDDFLNDYNALAGRGVKFCEEPRSEPYGMVAIFEDLYGNKWDLLEQKQ